MVAPPVAVFAALRPPLDDSGVEQTRSINGVQHCAKEGLKLDFQAHGDHLPFGGLVGQNKGGCSIIPSAGARRAEQEDAGVV